MTRPHGVQPGGRGALIGLRPAVWLILGVWGQRRALYELGQDLSLQGTPSYGMLRARRRHPGQGGGQRSTSMKGAQRGHSWH